ncbi:MAG: magnesium transporter CorA family protein [Bacteroidota bacterium]
MIRYYKRQDRQLQEIETLESSCWVNIAPPFSQEELEEVAVQFDMPLDFLTDSLDIDERSRYEREEDVRLIVINTPIENKNITENDALFITIPIGIVLTDDHIITISSQKNQVLQKFLDGKVKRFDSSNHRMFVLQIFEQTVYGYLTCLKLLNMQRNMIERELYSSSKNKELKALLGLEKSLVYFVSSLSANELLKMKIKRTNFLRIQEDEELTDLFEDIIIDNSQALDMANVYTNILNGTMDAYSSIISNNLNVDVRRLTLVTIVLSVPTFIASFFGMNIQLPFEDDSFAVVYVSVFAIILSAIVAWYFQRNRPS